MLDGPEAVAASNGKNRSRDGDVCTYGACILADGSIAATYVRKLGI